MAEKRTDDGKLAKNASSDCSVKEDSYNSTHDLDSDFVDGPEWKGNDDRNCVLTLFVRYRKAEGKKIVKEVKILPCSWNFLAYWNFYTKNKHGQKMLDDIVKKYGCLVTVCTDDEDIFIFEVTGTSFKQESDFLYFVNDVLDNIYKYAKQSLCCDFLSVDHRIQEDTLQRVKENEELHSAWIELVGEHDPDAVYVVCAVKDKVSVLDVLTAIISEAKECYNNHEDTVAIDFLWQRVLKIFGYLQDLNDKFPNVMIKPDEAKHTVVLKGPRDESKAAADHLLELFGSARGEVHEKVFSPVCQFEILTYSEMCDYIDNSIPKLPVVWMPNNLTKKIHIFSKQPEQAKGIDKSVKGCIQEKLYPLSKNHSLLHPGVRPLEKLKKKHKGKIVIHATDAGLLVTTADDVFETVDDDIQEIISKERAGLCSWTYEDRVLLAGLSSEVNSDNLTNFLEAKVGLTPTKFMYGDKEDKVIITFDENIDFNKLGEACKKQPLEDCCLQPSKVPISNCIMISNIKINTTEATIVLYFENEKQTWGGPVERVEFNREKEFCLVFFEDHTICAQVLQQEHQIDGSQLQVSLHYECLGHISKDDTVPSFKSPKPVKLEGLPFPKMQFLMKSEPNKAALEKQLHDCFTQIQWPMTETDCITLTCTLTSNVQDCKKKALTWAKQAVQSLHDFLKLLSVHEYGLVQEIYERVLQDLQNLVITNPDGVALFVKKTEFIIQVVGYKALTTVVVKDIEHIIKIAKAEYHRKMKQAKESLTTFKHDQLKLLLANNYPSKLQKKYKGLMVKINLNKNKIVFEGCMEDIRAAQVDLYEAIYSAPV